MSRSLLITAFLCLSVFLAGAPALAQSNPFNERDDQYRLLGLKRAKEAFEIARESHARNMKLFEQGVVAKNKADANGNWSRAEATNTGVEAVQKTFPDSKCDPACLKAQLDAYHDKAKTSDPEEPIRAMSSMEAGETTRAAAADDMGVPWPPGSTR